MIIRYPKSTGAGRGTGKDEKAAALHEADHDDSCRCKEASQMSAGELLKLMVGDLAFWKKMKPPKTEKT